MSEEPKKVTGYTITPISTSKEEWFQADSYQLEGVPLTYVFQHRGKEVKRLFASALEKEPVPTHPASAARIRLQGDLRDRAKRINEKRRQK
jgi:hypothetical protein